MARLQNNFSKVSTIQTAKRTA